MPDAASSSPRGRPWRIAMRVIVPVVFAAALWYLFTEVVRFGYVVSSSMEPTLQVGDYYTLRVDAYDGNNSPQRGEIVVYSGPDGAPYVKRVIGLGGEMIEVWFGHVLVNGQRLREPYVTGVPVMEPPRRAYVPPGTVFVLGDNREMSEDSRDYGPVPVDRLMGRVTKIVWPRQRVRALKPTQY